MLQRVRKLVERPADQMQAQLPFREQRACQTVLIRASAKEADAK